MQCGILVSRLLLVCSLVQPSYMQQLHAMAHVVCQAARTTTVMLALVPVESSLKPVRALDRRMYPHQGRVSVYTMQAGIVRSYMTQNQADKSRHVLSKSCGATHICLCSL